MFIPHPRVKLSIVESLRDREVACSASDRQGSNFESCVWRTVSSHYPQEILLAQFSLYVHKGGLKPDSLPLLQTRAGALGQWLAPLPFTLEFRVRFTVSAVWQKQNVYSPSTCETQYCGEPPWPRGSVLGLRPPGLEFRIMCLRWSKARFISFHFLLQTNDLFKMWYWLTRNINIM